jgi:uncharacterized membrane protein
MWIRQSRFPYDLLFLSLLTAGQLTFVWFGITNVLRIGTGFLFVVFVPGYLLLTVLLDGNRAVYIGLKRLILSLPVSMALSLGVGLVAYLVDPRSVDELVQAVVQGALVAILGVGAVIKRGSAVVRGIGNFVLFISVLAVTVSSFVFVVLPRSAPESYSFYVLGENGMVGEEPLVVQQGSPLKLVLGGEYVGEVPLVFVVTSSLGDRKIVKVNPPRDSWQIPIEETFQERGRFQLRWELSIAGSSVPVRELSLWVVVE